MNRFQIPAIVLTACLATPLLCAQTPEPAQTAKPSTAPYAIDPAAGNTKATPANSGTTVPVAAPANAAKDLKAEQKEEKKAKKKSKKKKAEEGDVLPAGMIPGHLIYSVPAEKPKMAREAHVSGTVTLKATVRTDGSLHNIKAISGPGMLRQAAIDAVSQWKYSPYMLNGAPSPAPTTIHIKFK